MSTTEDMKDLKNKIDIADGHWKPFKSYLQKANKQNDEIKVRQVING